MSGNEPNKHKRGEGWGDGEMGRWGNMEETNKKKEVTNFIEILGFPDSGVFLPRPALCDSVFFFLSLKRKKGLNTGHEVTI